MIKNQVEDVLKNHTLAIIVHQKITKEIVVADVPSTNINQRSPKSIVVTITQVIIQTLQTKVPIRTKVKIYENVLKNI